MGVVLVCPTEAQAGKGRGQVGWKVWREVRLGRAVRIARVGVAGRAARSPWPPSTVASRRAGPLG